MSDVSISATPPADGQAAAALTGSTPAPGPIPSPATPPALASEAVSSLDQKHALKASTNRSVTVNTERASTLTTTTDDSTIREITNINVARTLNYVLRQMNQEHVVRYHLTNARSVITRRTFRSTATASRSPTPPTTPSSC